MPAQGGLVHISASSSCPEQKDPPLFGAGLEQDLLRNLIPIPQVTLQGPNLSHPDQPPSTDVNKIKNVIENPNIRIMD
jgi:hypothetical protein